MFGLSLREKLQNTITQTALANINQFKKSVISLHTTSGNLSDKELSLSYNKLLKDFFEHIANEMLSGLSKQSPAIAMRVNLLMMDPSRAGFGDIDPDVTPLTGGIVYAFCYYCITGQTAKEKDCIFMNNVYRTMIHQALDEIEEILPERV